MPTSLGRELPLDFTDPLLDLYHAIESAQAPEDVPYGSRRKKKR